jgi:hypothetical protein
MGQVQGRGALGLCGWARAVVGWATSAGAEGRAAGSWVARGPVVGRGDGLGKRGGAWAVERGRGARWASREGEKRDWPLPFLSYFLYLLFFSILSTNPNRIH